MKVVTHKYHNGDGLCIINLCEKCEKQFNPPTYLGVSHGSHEGVCAYCEVDKGMGLCASTTWRVKNEQ